MTVRAATIASVALGLLVAGWLLDWPELTAMGAGGLALVGLSGLLSGTRPDGEVTLVQAPVHVTRGDRADVRLTVVAPRRRRWMRVVEGRTAAPTRTVQVATKGAGSAVEVNLPLDTSRRGEHRAGPYRLVHGDPWSVVRRTLSDTSGTTFVVLPRTFPVPRQVATRATATDSVLSSRRAGEHHFHALRDYVLGDEPRMVHWRSSARVGHLVVRQQVSAAAIGTMVVLDCDRSAYGSGEQFGVGLLDDRFEAAVEVAASFAASTITPEDPVELRSTARGSQRVRASAGSRVQVLEVLARAQVVAPSKTEPESLPRHALRSRSARVIVVSGSPRPATLDAVRRIQRAGVAAVLIRVGSDGAAPSGLAVVDVTGPEQLATCHI